MHSKEKRESKSSEIVADLLKEVEENIVDRQKDIHPLPEKLKNLTPDERQAFWGQIFKKGDERTIAMLEEMARRNEWLMLDFTVSLGRWLSPRAVTLLQRIALPHPSKTIAKAVRKSLFRLKSQGLAAEEIPDPAPSIYRPPQPAQGEGYLSHVDYSGDRMLWFNKPQISRGVVAFTALISDINGIQQFSGVETSRKNFHQYLAELPREYTEDIVEADPLYCYRLVADAYEGGRKSGHAAPPGFLEWQSFLGPFPPSRKPLIYEFLKEEEIKARLDLPDLASSLFTTAPFQSWVIPAEQARKYLLLLENASQSKLVLSEYQKENRVMEIYHQAVRELFDLPQRLLFRRRLEENAYILWKKEQAQEARVCLASALRLEEEGGILAVPSFLVELVKRSVYFWLEDEKEKKKEGTDLIIRP